MTRFDRWRRLIDSLAYDRVIRHQVFLEQYKRGHVRRMQQVTNQAMVRLLQDRMRDLEDITPGRALSVRAHRQREALIGRLANIAGAGIREVATKNLRELVEVGKMEREFLLDIYGGGLTEGFTMDLETPSISMIRTLANDQPFNGMVLADQWEKMEQGVRNSIQQHVREGLVLGEHPRQISARVMRHSVGMARRHVETMTRTSVHHVAHQTRLETFRNTMATDTKDPLIVAEQHVSTIDGRTSKQCMALDDRFFGVGEGPVPPVHPNCRSTRVPIMRRIRMRDVPEGEPPARPRGTRQKKETYNAFLKRQDKETQNELLGSEEKGKAFRRGKLHVRDFTDAQGHPRSLNELVKLESKPWRDRIASGGSLPGELTRAQVADRVAGR